MAGASWLMTHLMDEAERQFSSLVELQRDLHAHPEIGYEEKRTSARVAEELSRLGLEPRTGVVETGVIADLCGEAPGDTLALRVDMDAFPIDEAPGLAWRSRYPGAAHVCGHDAHTAIGIGVARVLARVKAQLKGTIRFIFQPAEERPLVEDEGERPYREGVRAVSAAELMIRSGALEPDVKAVFGLHLWPALPTGRIGIEQGAAMAGVANFLASVYGRSAHGAMPDQGVDAIAVTAQLLSMLQLISSRQKPPSEPLVITVGTIRGGDRRNVIADRVDITGTVRALSSELLRNTVPGHLRAMFDGVTSAMGASYDLEYYPLIAPVMNDAALVQGARAAVASVLGGQAVVPDMEKAMTSEDFACFAERLPGLYIKIGCTAPGQPVLPLHFRGFRFDESAIKYGVAAMAAIICDRLATGDRDGLEV